MHLVLAYLDPTTGSLAYQVTISTVLAGAATVRIYWKRLKQIFARRRSEKPVAAAERVSELEVARRPEKR